MKTIIFLFSIISSSFSYCQTKKIDTLSIHESAKFQTLRLENSTGEIKIDDYCLLDNMIKSKFFKTKTLKSKGFGNYIFIQVSFAEDFFFDYYLNGQKDEFNIEEIFFFDFILAYDFSNKIFYKIKGFRNNDFPLLYSEIIRYTDKKTYKILSKKNKKAINLATKKFYIENINLPVLIKNKDDINNWKIPELWPSPSRVLIDENGNYHFQ